MDKDQLLKIGEEEYIIMNLDSRQMRNEGTTWSVMNTMGSVGLDEPIPYVTSIELVESFIPNTFYNVESYNNILIFGTEIERYIINSSDSDVGDMRPVYSLSTSKGLRLTEIPIQYSDKEIGVPGEKHEREYVKIAGVDVNTLDTYNLLHTVSVKKSDEGVDIGYEIKFMYNEDNETIDCDTLFVSVETKLGVIIIQGDVTRKRGDNIGKELTMSVGAKRRTGVQFDTYATADGDDIETDVVIRVFTKVEVKYPAKNYKSDDMLIDTNRFIHDHLKTLFKPYRDEIVDVMSYDKFIELHLSVVRDDAKKKLEFISKHNHGFFIDLRHESSINSELGFSKKLYLSRKPFEPIIHSQQISIGDTVSSISHVELSNILNAVSDGLAIHQTYIASFFQDVDDDYGGITLTNNYRGLMRANIISDVEFIFVNDYPYWKGKETNYSMTDTFISLYALTLNVGKSFSRKSDQILPTKKSNYNMFVSEFSFSDKKVNQLAVGAYDTTGNNYAKSLNDITFIERIEYTIDTQVLEGDNMINLSGERYIDLVCTEIEGELKRYNTGYNKLYRYYFDDVSDLYVTSTKGNVTDLVLRNPRDFGPISRLSKLTFEFLRSDGNVYDFKNIPFYITIAIKYLKPRLRSGAELLPVKES